VLYAIKAQGVQNVTILMFIQVREVNHAESVAITWQTARYAQVNQIVKSAEMDTVKYLELA